ncbi:MAG: SpoVR family protein, partial [Alicyclobacillus sp.]|nr:SpoVR family protein [Alicyclobacillus sp.]
MNREDWARLEKTIEWMESKAREFGLDFFDMRYEICPADVVYTIAGFGMPTRYSHWSFGKQYYRQKLDFDLGISRIYELVVNSDPCYAFLLDSNTVLQNEMIVAHVLGHSDFFKHNARFRYTNRRMVDSMAAAAERIRKYEETYGITRVEEILDAALSIQEHVDASFRAQVASRPDDDGSRAPYGPGKPRPAPGAYDDLWSMDAALPAVNDIRPSGPGDRAKDTGNGSRNINQNSNEIQPDNAHKGTGEGTTNKSTTSRSAYGKDLLRFIITHSKHLEEWERDIVSTVRDEMLYFWPQLETKIMNEGWATYWHTRLMQERELTGQDAVDFALLTANV